ncbi:ferredoxin--NADP reductase [bacterium]|nr:ferredoxin--NADP reductase [bacterium]
MIENPQLNATLVSRTNISEWHTIFRVELDNGPLEFIPGQWTEMGLPRADREKGIEGPDSVDFVKDGIVRRAYSIASTPGAEYLEFVFNFVETGHLTHWLWKLQPGDKLFVEPEARGGFTISDISPDKILIMVATGTGVAPFISMLRAFHGRKQWEKFVLIEGARSKSQLPYYDEILELVKKDPSIVYLPTLTREESKDWKGLRGRVQELFRGNTLEKLADICFAPDCCNSFLCGNSDMIASVESLLIKKGFTPRWQDATGEVHTEFYY